MPREPLLVQYSAQHVNAWLITASIQSNKMETQNKKMEDQRYAGFWIRSLATLIDVVIILVVIGIPLSLIYGSDYWLGDQFYHGFWDLMFSYILPFIATIWFWLKYLGTPGKLMLGLRVVDAHSGHCLAPSQAIGRYFAYFVSTIPLLLGYIWIGLDKRKQGFHDKLAGSVVIRKPSGEDTATQNGADRH